MSCDYIAQITFRRDFHRCGNEIEISMRTTQELLEYVDRMIHIGVDKMEMRSQFALIDLQPKAAEKDEICGKMLVPLVVNAEDLEGTCGDGI